MTRSSRHKSHKQCKRSSRDDEGDDREYSDSEGDAKMKEVNGKDDEAVRVSRDLCSGGEKRKVSSQSRDCKDPLRHGNDDVSEEHVSSRRRKDRTDITTTDRWNGGGSERSDGVVVDKDTKLDNVKRADSEKGSTWRGSIDTKSKPSRRRDGGGEKEENEKEESKSGRVGSKRKLEKDSGRKEVQLHKESKEKEHGSENDRQEKDVKRCTETKGGDGEVKRRQGSQLVDFGEVRQVKQAKNAELPLLDESRNPELEKELEKRIKRRTNGSTEREKYQDDVRESDEKRLSSRGDHSKNGKHRDETQKAGSGRDKYREDIDRDHRHRDRKQREDVDRDDRHRDGKEREDVDRGKRPRDDKYRDDRVSRDNPSGKYDLKHTRDENNASESRHKKLRSQNSDHDGSPVYDDRRSRHKDDKERRRFDDREDRSDLRSQSLKERRYDAEKKSTTGKLESDTDRGRSYSRHIDLDSGIGHNRHRSSPSSSSHVLKDQYRQSKQAETKFRHLGSEERTWPNAVSTREVAAVSGVVENASVCQSMEESLQKDDNYLGELSVETCPNSDARVSSMQWVEKSHSSSIDRRYSNRASVWRSIDTEDSGHRSGRSKDSINYSGNEGKGGRDLHLQIHSGDDLPQVDGYNLTLPSHFGRNRGPTNTKSFLPPPSKAGFDGPITSVFGSAEDDNRGKSNNRDKRIGDSKTGRAWKAAPSWPPPVTNGFIPFQHAPPPVGFHPMMQQFSAPSMFGIRHPRELNHTMVPYHIPDSERFSSHARPFGWQNPVDESCPPMHAWDANNLVMGSDSHMYGRLDWEHNRTMMSSRGWETSVDMWKQSGGGTLELPSVSQKEDYLVPAPPDIILPVQSDQLVWSEQNESNLWAESIEINQSNDVANDNYEGSEDLSEKPAKNSKKTRNDDTRLSHFYLAKLDISSDLAHPELYNRCTSLMEPEQGRTVDEDASQLFLAEVETGVRVRTSSKPGASLFATTNDSVFQRAVSLYKRQKEEMRATFPTSSIREEVLSHDADNMECVSMTGQEKGLVLSSAKQQEKQEEAVPTCDMEVVEGAVSVSKQVKVEMPELEMTLAIDEKSEPFPANTTVEPNPTNEVKLEVDPVSHQATSVHAVEDLISIRGNHSPSITEEHKKGVDTMYGSLLFSSVSPEAIEAGLPESIGSGLVNLSRIHQSQSTH